MGVSQVNVRFRQGFAFPNLCFDQISSCVGFVNVLGIIKAQVDRGLLGVRIRSRQGRDMLEIGHPNGYTCPPPDKFRYQAMEAKLNQTLEVTRNALPAGLPSTQRQWAIYFLVQWSFHPTEKSRRPEVDGLTRC